MNTQNDKYLTDTGRRLQKWGFRLHLCIYSRTVCMVAIVGIATATNDTWAAASFQGLGDLPGGTNSSSAAAISADGMVVVGSSSSASGSEAFRWTFDGDMVGIGDLSGGDFNSSAMNVSDDGSVIVGVGSSTSGREAFRWVQGVGMSGLGDLAGGVFYSEANGISADGSVVVGTGQVEGGAEGFRWTEGGGMAGIGFIDFPNVPIQENFSRAADISADGTVVAGSCNPFPFAPSGVACRWTESTGMISLGILPNDAHRPSSVAFATSADGSVVVGASTSDTGGPPTSEAFRWTESDGMVGLGSILDMTYGAGGTATAVSADGSVVVGISNLKAGDQAILWTAGDGIRLLWDVLTGDVGLDLTGWTLESATGISDDGLTIVGTGINPDGNQEAFIASLPEPGTLIVMAAGTAMLLRRRMVT